MASAHLSSKLTFISGSAPPRVFLTCFNFSATAIRAIAPSDGPSADTDASDIVVRGV